jgi:hypothetical protein
MVSYIKLGIDRCFDPNDQFYLAELLRKDQGVLALQTTFGEPVEATIYFNSSITNENTIKTAASSKLLLLGTGKEQTTVETGFIINETKKTTGEIPDYKFLQLFIPLTDISFNKYESYSNDKMLVYELPFKQAADPAMQKWIPYLVSHASNDDGVVRIQTDFTEEGPVIRIWFVSTITSVEKIDQILKSKEFTVHYPDKTVKKVKNPFSGMLVPAL